MGSMESVSGRASIAAVCPIVDAEFEQSKATFQRGTPGNPEPVRANVGLARNRGRLLRA
jgi:hypothetical protein